MFCNLKVLLHCFIGKSYHSESKIQREKYYRYQMTTSLYCFSTQQYVRTGLPKNLKIHSMDIFILKM